MRILYPMPENRPGHLPVTEKYPEFAGRFLRRILGKSGNPSKIERFLIHVGERHLSGRKGCSHEPKWLTYISWSNLLKKKYVDIQSEAHTLRRLAALEKKGKFRARAKTKNK
jgi:hydroxylamine dehydrogenase